MSETKQQKRHISKLWIVVAILFAVLIINQIPTGYYYSQPGEATGLQELITVEGSSQYEEGEFYLTTILQSRASPFLYVWSYLSPYRVLTPEDILMTEDETDEEYQHRQTESMRQSQDAAKIAAYRAAGATVHIEENGVFVTQFVDGMGAVEELESGDTITAVDDQEIRNFNELTEALQGKEAGEFAELWIEREGDRFQVDVEMRHFPDPDEDEDGIGADPEAVGLGIIFPVNDREVSFDPDVTIEAGAIGGPSAGLMFSLEIYNQLIEDEDITRGMNVAGTGSINEDGQVGRVGGVSQKVVAADRSGIEIFFTPNDEELGERSNYLAALEAANDVNADIDVVPVETLQDAIDYLTE
ncbi:PDZ domain-containing protein [Geomicrobium sp. JCM 19039]|uniref:YlbL family protein n=1 Tax=Geomicrobium sp. JCM 19039 TaxID=1460636 RepID=UPI00045F3D1C|nr:PDZ domain-containing protein [Geomicrobium sp. JCM 19039]GAK14500.1 Lon-like protease with PDZ domain [Geomicrobium sp. JCM 19039]